MLFTFANISTEEELCETVKVNFCNITMALKKQINHKEYEDLTNSRNYTTKNDYIKKIEKIRKTIRWWGIWLLLYSKYQYIAITKPNAL